MDLPPSLPYNTLLFGRCSAGMQSQANLDYASHLATPELRIRMLERLGRLPAPTGSAGCPDSFASSTRLRTDGKRIRTVALLLTAPPSSSCAAAATSGLRSAASATAAASSILSLAATRCAIWPNSLPSPLNWTAFERSRSMSAPSASGDRYHEFCIRSEKHHLF